MSAAPVPVEIRAGGDGHVLCRAEVPADTPTCDRLRCALEQAVRQGANLRGAVLTGADLTGADLTDADLAGAVLSGAVLTGADLSGADLSDAVLTGAVLTDADLTGADLTDADLTGAVLTGATWRNGVKLRRGVIKECSRSDGYMFRLLDCADGMPRLTAGCRDFAMSEAWEHWQRTRGGTPLGEETFDILHLFEAHIQRMEAEAHIQRMEARS
jgi:hypothetical protein